MISCYLDSQDYSTLTDPKLQDPKRDQIKSALLHLSRSRQVRFAFSAVTVSEAVALTAETSHLAERKAEFLSELCGQNALVSFDRLVEAEIRALGGRSGPPKSMFDQSGRWFPLFELDERPIDYWSAMRKLAEQELKANGFSRQQRREQIKSLFKHGEPRAELQALIAQQDPSTYAAQLQRDYAIRPEYAEVLAKYALGRGTEAEFNDALINSLNDPHWMMIWFSKEHSISSPVAELVRKPGRELGQALRQLVEISLERISNLQEIEPDTNPVGPGGEVHNRWKNFKEELLFNVIRRLSAAMSVKLDAFELSDVQVHCPGLATGVRSFASSGWENVGGGRKELPNDSQSVDALHAFYAPYVTVFRADRFMAPHVSRQVQNYGTIVVPRLSQLVQVLDEQLGQ